MWTYTVLGFGHKNTFHHCFNIMTPRLRFHNVLRSISVNILYIEVLPSWLCTSVNKCFKCRVCVCYMMHVNTSYVCLSVPLTGLQGCVRLHPGCAGPPPASGVRVWPQSGSAGPGSRQRAVWRSLATTNRPAAGPRTGTHTGADAGKEGWSRVSFSPQGQNQTWRRSFQFLFTAEHREKFTSTITLFLLNWGSKLLLLPLLFSQVIWSYTPSPLKST